MELKYPILRCLFMFLVHVVVTHDDRPRFAVFHFNEALALQLDDTVARIGHRYANAIRDLRIDRRIFFILYEFTDVTIHFALIAIHVKTPLHIGLRRPTVRSDTALRASSDIHHVFPTAPLCQAAVQRRVEIP